MKVHYLRGKLRWNSNLAMGACPRIAVPSSPGLVHATASKPGMFGLRPPPLLTTSSGDLLGPRSLRFPTPPSKHQVAEQAIASTSLGLSFPITLPF